jgi:hypothetical protein
MIARSARPSCGFNVPVDLRESGSDVGINKLASRFSDVTSAILAPDIHAVR